MFHVLLMVVQVKGQKLMLIFFTNIPPTVSNVSVCGSNTEVILQASGCSGMTFSWYSVALGGSSLGNSSSLLVTGITSDSTFMLSAELKIVILPQELQFL